MKLPQLNTIIAMFIALAISLGPVNPADAGEISADLQSAMAQASGDEKIAIIIQLKDKVNKRQFKKFKKKLRRNKLIKALKQQAKNDQASLDTVLKGKKGLRLRQLWLINGVAIKADKKLIRKLAKLKAVESIRLDGVITLADPDPTGSGTASWNLSMVQADAMWSQGYDGQGVVVAAMDTGVDANHNALSGSYRGGGNSWYDPNGEHASPFDVNGHGTQTMGVLVGSDGMGIAPSAQWIAAKIFNDAGQATYSGIHSAFQWMLDPDNDPATDDSPDVVNNSWGFNETLDECFTEFEQDIDALRTAEIAVVFSAGNSGPAAYTSLSPANNSGSLAVGALDENSQVIPLSSTGPSACSGGIYPQLSGPGLNIFTAGLTYGGIFPDMTTYASGTSLSAPHIAGAMALLRNALPDATVADMEQALIDSAQDLGLAGPDDSYGYGLVQTASALDLLGGGTVGGSGGGGGDDPPPPPPPGPVCTDADDDGFFSADSDPECGGPIDCVDNNDTIYPGAPEINGDGVDQDCNGYDLTIQITRAIYKSSKNRVIIWSTSALGSAASLSADVPGMGVYSLKWNSSKNRWQKSIGKATNKGFDPANPGSVLVSGPEGEVLHPITIK